MKRIILALALCMSVSTLRAQEPFTLGFTAEGDSISINLEEAIKIALSDNPTIMVSTAEIQRQNYVRQETVGNLLPSLNATGQYNYNLMNPVMFLPADIFGPGTGGATRMGFSNSFTGGVTLAVPLYMPMVYETLQLNKEQMLEAVEKARSSKIELATQVKKSYYAVLLTESTVQLAKENIALAEEVVQNSQDAYNQGVVSQYDLITSQVQLSNLNPTLYQAESANYNARLMFNMLLGLPLDTKVAMEEDLTSYVEYIEQNNEFIIDLSNNAELNLMEIQQSMLASQLRIQKAVYIPTLSAFGQYQVVSQSNDLALAHYDWRGTALLGLQLDIPIFKGLKNTNKERSIVNQQVQLDFQKDYLIESLNVEAQTAVTNIESAKKQMNANLTAHDQAQKGYEIALTRYENGMGTIVEVNQAQVQLIQADMNYRESIYNYMVAKADYDNAIGADF